MKSPMEIVKKNALVINFFGLIYQELIYVNVVVLRKDFLVIIII